MRVRIPFFYRAEGVMASGSFAGDVLRSSFLESFEHEIPEVKREDFPFTFFYLEGAPSRSLPHEVRVGTGGIFYRNTPWHAGRGDIRKSLDASCLDQTAKSPKAAYKALLAERSTMGNSPYDTQIMHWYEHGRGEENTPVSERFSSIHETDRDLMLLEAKEFADRMVVIDGELVFRCEEPKIVVSLNNNMAPALITAWCGATRYGTVINKEFGITVGSPTKTRFFRADDIDGALAFVAKRGIDNEIQYGREFICPRPQLMTFDPTRDFAVRSAEELVHETASAVGLMEAAAVQSWLNLRDDLPSMTPEVIMDHVRILAPHSRNKSTRLEMSELLSEWEHFDGTDALPIRQTSPKP
jgi:hypothetical protein